MFLVAMAVTFPATADKTKGNGMCVTKNQGGQDGREINQGGWNGVRKTNGVG